MNTEKFEKILGRTVISSELKFEDQLMLSREPVIWSLDNAPEHLYRYRSCNEMSFEAFYHDKVFVSSANSMNDGFDARIYFDNSTLENIQEKIQSEEVITQCVQFLKKNLFSISSRAKNNVWRYALFPSGQPSDEEIIAATGRSIAIINNNFSKAITEITEDIQRSLKIACFSEDITSPAMWGHYSDNESGFALMYGWLKEDTLFHRKSKCLQFGALYPVIYKDRRYQVGKDYAAYLIKRYLLYLTMVNMGVKPIISKRVVKASIPRPDTFAETKIALHKSVEWAYEKEWRLFCYSDDLAFEEVDHDYVIKKPLGLFLGRRILPINEKILSDIAKEKNIPVYKMRLNNNDDTYMLWYT